MKHFKKLIFFLFVYQLFPAAVVAQNVNGVVLSDSANITVVKLWGTHYERGYAYGYLMGDKISDMVNGYIKPVFGIYMDAARQIIINGDDLSIDSVYVTEAMAVIDGMNEAGTNYENIDYIDGLVFNSFLDVLKLLGFSDDTFGCSSLMSWGDATTGTALNGMSVVSRHLDWTPDQTLIDNQVLVIHNPAEEDEQPWAMVGFAGQMSVLSGFNQNIAVFQHMMSDFVGLTYHGLHYEPVWLTLRKAIEKADFNNDGVNNTQDVRDAIELNTNGYANGYIVTSLAPSTAGADSLIAMVAEVAPQNPKLTFRSNSYPDDIPGDNLYAANFEIKRNNHNHYGSRYYAIMNAIGDGLEIGEDENWLIMKDNSNGQSGNIQFMQFIPETDIFKLTVYRNNTPAYLNNPVVYSVSELLSLSTVVNNIELQSVGIYPNPAHKILYVNVNKKDIGSEYLIISGNGKVMMRGLITNSLLSINTDSLKRGVYFIKTGYSPAKKFIKSD